MANNSSLSDFIIGDYVCQQWGLFRRTEPGRGYRWNFYSDGPRCFSKMIG